MPFEPPSKHRIDSVMWWLIRDRSAVVMAVVMVTMLIICIAVRCLAWMARWDPHWSIYAIHGAVFYWLDVWLTRVIMRSWHRRVAWQAYWDHIYRDGDIVRRAP